MKTRSITIYVRMGPNAENLLVMCVDMIINELELQGSKDI